MNKIEVQVRILLRDKELKSCQNTNTTNHTLIKEKFLLGFFIVKKQPTRQGMFQKDPNFLLLLLSFLYWEFSVQVEIEVQVKILLKDK